MAGALPLLYSPNSAASRRRRFSIPVLADVPPFDWKAMLNQEFEPGLFGILLEQVRLQRFSEQAVIGHVFQRDQLVGVGEALPNVRGDPGDFARERVVEQRLPLLWRELERQTGAPIVERGLCGRCVAVRQVGRDLVQQVEFSRREGMHPAEVALKAAADAEHLLPVHGAVDEQRVAVADRRNVDRVEIDEAVRKALAVRDETEPVVLEVAVRPSRCRHGDLLRARFGPLAS